MSGIQIANVFGQVTVLPMSSRVSMLATTHRNGVSVIAPVRCRSEQIHRHQRQRRPLTTVVSMCAYNDAQQQSELQRDCIRTRKATKIFARSGFGIQDW